MSNEVAVAATGSALVIHADQSNWTSAQLAGLAQIGVENAPPAELQVFFHQCQRTGLDPFAKQIYMLSRRSKNSEGQWVTKWTHQVGIDGYRLIANRAAKREGVRVGHHAPLYADESGVWCSILPKGVVPVACQYTVSVDGVDVTAVCFYDEYVQTYTPRGGGDPQPNSMWTKMPGNQLAKCTEAAALRKAFPADYSGIVLEDASQPTIIDGDTGRVVRSERGVGGLKASLADDDPVGDVIAQPSIGEQLVALLTEAELTTEDEQLLVFSALVGRDILSPQETTAADVKLVVDELADLKAKGRLTEGVSDLINAAQYAAQQD